MDTTEFEKLQEGREESHKGMGSSGITGSNDKLLFVPRCSIGDGAGHLKRTIDLAARFGELAYILSSFHGENIENTVSSSIAGEKYASLRFLKDISAWGKNDLIIVDRKSTSAEDYMAFQEHGIPVGMDEGGEARTLFPYLIDTLPMLPGKEFVTPNAFRIHAGIRKNRSAPYSFPFRKILVSFGGEDRADCSSRILDTLLSAGIAESADITLVEGPLFERHAWPDCVRVVVNPPSMEELLADADCLFTHFGLTCFEALSMRTPVILLNPTQYHRSLSIRSRIPEIGVVKPDVRKLEKLLSDGIAFDGLVERARSFFGEGGGDPYAVIASLRPDARPECPFCGTGANRSVARFENRTYFECVRCESVYLVGFSSFRKTYDSNYFFEEYASQYGKTYVEDFSNIKSMGEKRLSLIRALAKKKEFSLYEAGCAYGPFLSACLDAGIDASGCDISEDACAYVSELLGIRCDTLDFENADSTNPALRKKYGALAMWYVIEHFRNPAAVLKRINSMLEHGGIFAFSTPNRGGISGRSNMRRFLETSPMDHRSVWNARSARKTLKLFGFKVRKIRVTGHHPERFPFVTRFHVKGKTLLGLFRLASLVFGLGDTFEIYAVKERDI